MSITAADVKKLRDMTGAGMMDSKKALTEAEGDFEKAVEILRKKGQKVADKRADRDAKEGLVLTRISDDAKKVTLLKSIAKPTLLHVTKISKQKRLLSLMLLMKVISIT